MAVRQAQANDMQKSDIFKKIMNSDYFPLLLVVLLKIILHLITINRYGYFIDELYNIAATRHLSHGILEMSSLGPMIYAGWIFLFGPSMASIRMLALIPGVVTVIMSGLIARELGGKRPAQFMTALFVCLGPVWLTFNSFLGCDGFDQAVSAVFLFLLIKILKTGNQKYWIAAGIAAGTAILFKQTLFFYLVALFLSLLLTNQRKVFLGRYLWMGVLCGFLILIPQFFRGFWANWPLLEYWYIYSHHRTYHASLLEFTVIQILLYAPLAAPVWIAGLFNFIFNKKMQPYRTLGFLYIFLMPVCFVMNVKGYATAAVYPVLFAGGFILLEEYFVTGWKKNVRRAYAGLIIVTMLLAVPHGLPLFNVENQTKYFQLFSFINRQVKFDNFARVTLPEYMADRIGWEERVKVVADVYNNLAADEKKKTSIYAAYYGFAGAIDLLGKKYDLPDALSGHLSYHLWGYGNQRPENLLTVQVPCESLLSVCENVRISGYIPFIPYAMPYDNNKPICLCRKMKYTIEEIWPLTKHYD